MIGMDPCILGVGMTCWARQVERLVRRMESSVWAMDFIIGSHLICYEVA